jgi:hypothetical protein
LRNNDYIDNLVFSVYLQMNVGNSTHIKFGGFDHEGVLGGNPQENLHFLKTKNIGTWQVAMSTVKVGNTIVDVTANSTYYKERYILFELAYPYIYMPVSDFR